MALRHTSETNHPEASATGSDVSDDQERMTARELRRGYAAGIVLGAIVLGLGYKAATYEAPGYKQLVQGIEKSYGGYAPQIDGTHRELTVGNYKRGIIFANLTSMADYVHLKNPSVDQDTALGVMELSVIEDHKKNHTPDGQINPYLVMPGQAIRIPEAWGVGRLVKEENQNSATG